jgi:pyruvate formate lyase activating enzyme
MNTEKGNISEIQRFCIHDGPGIRTTVFLKGCPLRCAWCANPETQDLQKELMYLKNNCFGCGRCLDSCECNALSIVQDKKIVIDKMLCTFCGSCIEACRFGALELKGDEMEVFDVLDLLMKDSKFFEHSNGGLTISGGEPTFQSRFAIDLLKKSKKVGINTAIETCGYCKKNILIEMAEYVDTIMIDLKIADSANHEEWTGLGNGIIVENIRALLELDASKVLIRVPLIEGVNTEEAEINKLADLINNLYENINQKTRIVELMPYHRLGTAKYEALQRNYILKDLPPLEQEIVENIKMFFDKKGITAFTS